MPLDASIYNNVQAPDVSPLMRAIESYAQQKSAEPFKKAALGQQQQELVNRMASETVPQVQALLDSGDANGAMEILQAGRQQLEKAGIQAPPSPILKALQSGDIQTATKLSHSFTQLLHGNGQQSRIGTYNPRDYTTESFAQFTETGDPSVLERYESQKSVDIGGVPHVFNPAQGGYFPAQVSGTGSGIQAPTPVTTESVAESRSTIAAETKGAEQVAQDTSKRLQEFVNRGVSAAESLPILRRTKTLLDEVETGGFSAAALKAKRMFGVEGADEGELSYNLGKAVLTQLRETFGAAFTAAEGQQLAQLEASISRSPAANARIIQQALTMAEKKAQRGMQAAQKIGDDFTVQDISGYLEMTLDPPQDTATPSEITLPNGVTVRRVR